MVATPRRKASNKQADSSDDDTGPNTSSNGALASFVNATTSYKSKRRKIQRTRRASDVDEEEEYSIPFAAFPPLGEEVSDRPLKARRQAYLSARQWLYSTSEGARQESSHPITAEVTRVLASIAAKEIRGGIDAHRNIPLVCVPNQLPASLLWSSLQSTDDQAAPRALFVADQASAQDARHILAAACRHWLAEVFNDRAALSLGCTALWKILMARLSSSDTSPVLLLGLSGVSHASLFSTLAYLMTSVVSTPPRLIVVLHAARGLDGLPWEEQRHLEIYHVMQAQHQTAPLLHRLFLDLHAPPPLVLPAEVLDLASRHPDHQSQIAIIDLALQRLYSSTAALAFGPLDDETARLYFSDFTQGFFQHIRQSLLQTLQCKSELEEPDLSLLPPFLQDGKALKTILQGDEALFESMPALVQGHLSAWQDRLIALNMLRQSLVSRADTPAPQSLETFATLLITTPPGDVTKSLTIRRMLNDLLAPMLRAIRRGENEEGGLAIAELEQWLDRLEDWAAPLEANADSMQTEELLSKLLQSIRCFQQELYTTQLSIDDVDGESAVPSQESSRFTQVEKKLQRDEALRSSRGRIADWFASTLRKTLLRHVPDILFVSPSCGADLAMAIECLLFPSPRSHITVALSRPHLYLQHFVDVVESSQRSSSPSFSDDEKMQQALQTLRATLSSSSSPSLLSSDETQTDLSRAFDLLREAGGPGTGVKGRMINLYDWYQAWLASGGMQHDDQTQVNFSLALSTLAGMGYIRKTRKGNGEFVLKTGGWDVMPWKTLPQSSSSTGPSKDEDDVF